MAKRPLKQASTEELRTSAEDALSKLAGVLHEAVHRKGAPGRALFDELRWRRPLPGGLEAPDAVREHSVYVVELRPSILDDKPGFRRKNPDYVKGKLCLYVGQAYHSPEERFRQHLAGERAGRGYVRDYGIRLRPDFYRDRNPPTEREALVEERALASELRDEGYGVWQN